MTRDDKSDKDTALCSTNYVELLDIMKYGCREAKEIAWANPHSLMVDIYNTGGPVIRSGGGKLKEGNQGLAWDICTGKSHLTAAHRLEYLSDDMVEYLVSQGECLHTALRFCSSDSLWPFVGDWHYFSPISSNKNASPSILSELVRATRRNIESGEHTLLLHLKNVAANRNVTQDVLVEIATLLGDFTWCFSALDVAQSVIGSEVEMMENGYIDQYKAIEMIPWVLLQNIESFTSVPGFTDAMFHKIVRGDGHISVFDANKIVGNDTTPTSVLVQMLSLECVEISSNLESKILGVLKQRGVNYSD